MKRFVAGSLALVICAAILFWFWLPHERARRCTRAVDFNPNLIDPMLVKFDETSLPPFLVQTEQEYRNLVEAARKRARRDFIDDQGLGLDNAGMAMKDIDFSRECLLVIIFWRPDDDPASLSTRLSSKRLNCTATIASRDRWFGPIVRHPSYGLEPYCLAISRDAVEEVDVKIPRLPSVVLQVKPPIDAPRIGGPR